jgi:putative nucleotidyltransferase with HDIG domain
MAETMGLPDDEKLDLRRGALMHDIGKLGVPDAILLKPGPLSQEERALMRRHAEHGLRMLEGIDFLQGAVKIIGAHHENYDGTGYPRGLKGDDIPLGARIFMVADTFDAITSNRRYRNARTYEEARREIIQESGKQFDPKVVEVFLSIPEREWMRLRSVTIRDADQSDE